MVFFPTHIEKIIDKDQIEREYLQVPKFALRALGYWPHDKLLSLKVLPFTIAFLVILTLGVIAEVGFSYTHMKQLPLALDALCPALTKAVTVVKFIMILRIRGEVAKMLDDLKAKWINDTTPECSLMNLQATRVAKVFALILICFSNTASAGYSLRPLGAMLTQYLSGKPIVRELPFKSAYPYDAYEDPLYELSYIFIASTGTICCFGLAGMDGIFVALCLHISAQFRILKHDFDQMIVELKNAENEKTIQYSKSENDVINKRLMELIRRHQETIGWNEHMVELFTISIFSHFVSAALVLCCVSVNLLLAKDASAILYICYGIAAVTQLLIYCAGGTILQMASFDIHQAAYFTDWYKFDIRNQRLILLVILRGQTPCGIVVPFFESSLQTFTTIMRATGSYIALFRTFL